MAYYPLLIQMDGLPCLIAGGGAIALHKAQVLLAQGARVTVAAPELLPELEALPVTVRRRKVTAEDPEGMALAVDATGDPAAEEMLERACADRGILYDSACRVSAGTVIFPAVFRRGKTVVAVSSQGASPAASAWLRDTLKAHVPEKMDEILEQMAALRPLSRQELPEQADRRQFLHRCLDAMLQRGGPLEQQEICATLDKIRVGNIDADKQEEKREKENT